MRLAIRRIQSREMGSGPILPTLITIGLPTVVAGVMQSFYEITDRLFVSWLGTDEISGVSLIMPVIFCTFALAQAVNVGLAALLSRHLGAGKPDEAQRTLNHGLIMAAILGGSLTLGLLVWLDPLLAAMGGETDIVPHARSYARVVFAGVFFLHIGTAAEGALRAQGNTVTPMKVGIVTNIVNAVLTPVFIFGLGMGVQGSALATVIARSAASLVLLSRLWSPSSEITPGNWRVTAFADRLRIAGRIYGVGLPASVGLLSMALSLVIINRLLVDMHPLAVGVMGIAGTVEMAATVPIFALFSAVLPMVGYNLGARHYDRIRQTVWTAAWLAAGIMGTAGLIVFLFPATLFGFFTRDPEMLPMGVQYLRIMMPAYPLIGASIMMSAGFQGLGKSWIAMIMHLWRNILTKLPFALWFGSMWGITGVWWSFPASSLASAGFTIGWMVLVLRALGTDKCAHEPCPDPAEVEVPGP